MADGAPVAVLATPENCFCRIVQTLTDHLLEDALEELGFTVFETADGLILVEGWRSDETDEVELTWHSFAGYNEILALFSRWGHVEEQPFSEEDHP